MNQRQYILWIIIGVFVLCSGLLFSDLLFKNEEITKPNQTFVNMTNNTPSPKVELPKIIRTTGAFDINATIYMNSSTLPVYRGVLGKNDSINLQLKQIGKERLNVTTVEEAPEAAKRALESYGGLPENALYGGAKVSYSEVYNHTLHKITYREPMFITVYYYCPEINNMPVRGDSNSIILTLGTDGELLWLFKVWRNYTYAGEVPVISVDAAIKKLEREDLIDSAFHPEAGRVTIDTISQGYYAKTLSTSDTLLEPVWMMYGTGTNGNRLGFYIYARQFANFTASPTSGKNPLEVRFTDTSDTLPVTWFWDFGDGANSTLRNPVHTYREPGTYTVNLTVRNDLGTDFSSKKGLITIPSSQTHPSGSENAKLTNESGNIERVQ